MCRLFLYISRDTRYIPSIYLERFINIARVGLSKKCGFKPHGDGFGVVWVNDSGYGIYRSLNPIWREEISLPPAKLFLFHARKAGIGDIHLLNTHPFVKKGLILAHNGNIYGFSRKSIKYPVNGNTDSEKFLSILIDFLDYYGNLEKAFVESIKSIDLATELNMIIISILERKVIGSNLYFKPRYNCPNYSTMWIKKTNSELLVASEPLNNDNWSTLSKEIGVLTIFTVSIDDITKIKIIKTKI